MPKAEKAVRRTRKARKATKPKRTPVRTMPELIAALGGTQHISTSICTGDCLLKWFEFDRVQRGYGLQVFVSLLHRGYTMEQINPKLFDHENWHKHMIPVPKWERL